MVQGHSAMQDSPPQATGTFALDLSREGITLYWLSSHAVWNAVEHVVLQDGLVAERMAGLRARIGGQPEPARVDVWLPEEQVVVRVLETGGGVPTEAMVAALFADFPEFLEFDAEVRPGAEAYTIAAIPRAVLEQTRDFLEPHGFVVDNYTVRDAPAGMDHAPNFPLDRPVSGAAAARKLPPRGALAAAGLGLLVGGGLLAAVLTGLFGDAPPEVATADLARPAGLAAGQSGAPEGAADAGGRVPGTGAIRSTDTPVTYAEPANPLAVGRAQIDQPLPRAPEAAEAVGPLPLAGLAPRRGDSPRLAAVEGDMPRAPAIYARPIQTDIAELTAPATAASAQPVTRKWTVHAAALPGDGLAAAAGGGVAPDLSALREVPQPAVLVTDPPQGRTSGAVTPLAAPRADRGSYVAMLFGELDPPAAAPVAADVSGVRSRPASVAPPIMVALSAPAAEGDPVASAPPPQPAVARMAAAAAPVPAERNGPLPEFALSTPLPRPALNVPEDSRAAPADDAAPADPALARAQSLPVPTGLAALAEPSGPLPPADLGGVRSPARVDVALDWLPVQPPPEPLSAAPQPPAAETALNAMLLDILGAVPSDMAEPLIAAAEDQPRALVGSDGIRPDGAEPLRIAGLSAAPSAGASALGPPALAVQPLDLDTPRAADTHDELANLLSPINGIQVGRALGPRRAQPDTGTAPELKRGPDRPETIAVAAAPAEAAAAPEPVAPAAPGAELPRARVVPLGTVPELPDIEFAALDRSLGAADERPATARGPAMASPSAAPGRVAVPLPALPPSDDGDDVEVAVIAAEPDVVPPLRPEPQVIAARPEVVPPLRGTPEVIEARPDIVPPPRDGEEAGTEVAALSDPEIAPETADDGSDLALPRLRRPRPRPRPAEIEEAETARIAALAPSELALNRTDSPPPRPSNLAMARPDPAPAPAPSPAAPTPSAPEPKRAAPELPTSASVARAATIKNALPFGRMALIGVFGSSSNRHALVRLRNGDFIKVRNGETIEGYQITGMSNNAIRLQRGGRETLLVIPQ